MYQKPKCKCLNYKSHIKKLSCKSSYAFVRQCVCVCVLVMTLKTQGTKEKINCT